MATVDIPWYGLCLVPQKYQFVWGFLTFITRGDENDSLLRHFKFFIYYCLVLNNSYKNNEYVQQC